MWYILICSNPDEEGLLKVLLKSLINLPGCGVGFSVGLPVGLTVGTFVGFDVGAGVGLSVGGAHILTILYHFYSGHYTNAKFIVKMKHDKMEYHIIPCSWYLVITVLNSIVSLHFKNIKKFETFT